MALFLIVIMVAELILSIDIERRYAMQKRLIDSDIREMDLLINDCRVRLDAVEVLSDSVRKLNGVVKDLEQKQPKIEAKNRMNTRAFIAGWDADEPEPIQQHISKEEWSMLTTEQKKHIDAFEYWVKTNTENGVSILPESICKDIIAILKDKDGKTDDGQARIDASHISTKTIMMWHGRFVNECGRLADGTVVWGDKDGRLYVGDAKPYEMDQ